MSSELAIKHEQQDRAMVSFIERAATDQNVDIEKFERLIALQNQERDRQAKMAFDAAMAHLQADLPTISEKGAIKHGVKVISTYARFEDINEAIKPHLKEHGFAISFRSNFDNNMLLVTGILSHQQGHREETTMRLPFDNSGAKNNVQAIGSSVSYGKRYVLSMLLNISTGGEDDDGVGADVISAEDAAALKADLQATNSNVKKFCEVLGADSVDSIPSSKLAQAKALLQKKRSADK